MTPEERTALRAELVWLEACGGGHTSQARQWRRRLRAEEALSAWRGLRLALAAGWRSATKD